MKAFIYFSSGNRHPDLEVILSYAQTLADEGYEITFMIADDRRNTCLYNIFGSKLLQRLSQKRIELGLKLFQSPYRLVSNTQVEYTYKDYEFNSVEELKALKYKEADVGYAALSSYISATRQVLIDFNPTIKKILNRLLNTGIQNYLAFEQICQKDKFDRAIIYNGRFNDSRPILRLCQTYKIDTDVIDYSCVNSCVFQVKNVLIQDIKSNIEATNEAYKAMHPDQVQQIASDFFYKRRHGIATNEASYTLKQKHQSLPEGWDSHTKNIVIFSSSEDELCAIAPEWEKGLFSSQIKGLVYLSEKAKQETKFKFYVRIHPNMSTGQKAYLEAVYKLEHSNFIIIKPDSAVSSYTLMDQAWQVISFGSTMGIEATFWGKTSILIGMGLHVHFDCCYIPKTYDELHTLMHSDLQPKPKVNAYKIVIRLLKVPQPLKYFHMNTKRKASLNDKRIKLPLGWKIMQECARGIKKNKLKLLTLS